MGVVGVDWICPSQDTGKWKTLADSVRTLRFSWKDEKFHG